MIKYLFILLTFFTYSTKAQLCQGSLGDPLININFGSGNNPGPSLSAAATGYQYVSSDCPADGFYTVRNNTSSCFGNTWHSLSSDHTANGNGYFMLVNASLQPSAFYVDTVKGLCGSSTYEFAAWIMNVLLPSACNGTGNQPNLTFSIERTDGTVLQSYNSGNIPTTVIPTWNQYGFFFTTPASGADIVLRIVNNAPGGCGNDLALDDITFRPCGPQITPSINGQTTATAEICEGSTTAFTFNNTISAGFNNPVFQWQQRFNNSTWTDIPAANTTTYIKNFIPSNSIGSYQYRLSVAEAGNIGNAQCRISSQPLTVIINAKPVASASFNGPVCTGNTITLTATGGTQYNWTGPNGYTATGAVVNINNIQPAQAGSYTVLVSNAAGCSNSAAVTVTVNPSPVAVVPFSTASICTADSVQLSASGGGTYNWFPSSGLSAINIFNPKASPAVSTDYRVLVTNSDGCSDSAFIKVNVAEKAIANAGPDKTIILGAATTLSGSITGAYLSFSWSPNTAINNINVLQPIVNPAIDMAYVLTVQSNNGCGLSRDTVLVKLFNGIFIPNAFSPNNDGLNDYWNIPALDAYPDFELYVYNRYGNLVYANSRINKGWDGKYKSAALPVGAYPYYIKLNVNKKILKGTVMIIH